MSTAKTNFSDALSTWKDVNLSELQKTLDAQGLEIVENQKESVLGRKALAEKTKDFKKIPDDEKLSAWKTLLKAYQTEIDNLTKRSKVSENAFLNLYKKVAEAPDPYPLLDAAVEQAVKASQASKAESEVARLREENASLLRQISEYSGLESAKNRAEGKLATLEARMEGLVQERVGQREVELNAVFDEKMRNYEDREQDLSRQLSVAKTQLHDLWTSNDVIQAKLMDHSQKQDEETVAKLSELDMLAADLERANNRVATVERRNELLRAEIESVRSGREHNLKITALESQLQELTTESDRLSRALESQTVSHKESEKKLQVQLSTTAKELKDRVSEIETLRSKLRRYADYDEVKRELEIMKYVEFGGIDDDDGPGDVSVNGNNMLGVSLPNPNPKSDTANAPSKSLEALLAAKNIRIMEELTKFRVLHTDLEVTLTQLRHELEETKMKLEKEKSLNEKIEADLLQVDSRPPPQLPQSSSSSMSLMSNGNGNGVLSPASGTQTPAEKEEIQRNSTSTPTPIPFQPIPESSILPIVTSQRDRFRQRNGELEEELRKQFRIIAELRSEVKSLQADNLKLYEKVRYMQSYRDESASTSQLNPLPQTQTQPSGDLHKYHARYEEAMNPFEAFRGREAARAYQALNPAERAVLGLTKAILGNRRARNAFIIYAMALHILVMFTVYECTTSRTVLHYQPLPYTPGTHT